jgi:hypothetical protein
MTAHFPHPRPMQSNAVRYVRTLRKLSHAQQASCGDMIEVMDMIRAGDLRHIDEASEAFAASDMAEPLDLTGVIDAAEVAYSVTAMTGEALGPGGHGVPTRRETADYAVRIAAVRIGDLWIVRDDFALMVGDAAVAAIEADMLAQVSEAAE